MRLLLVAALCGAAYAQTCADPDNDVNTVAAFDCTDGGAVGKHTTGQDGDACAGVDDCDVACCTNNTCTCTDGTEAVAGSAACDTDGAEVCTACDNAGFTLAAGACTANTCTCTDGTEATGVACDTDGAENCTACDNAGFNLAAGACEDVLECATTPCHTDADACAEQVGNTDLTAACTCGAGFYGDGVAAGTGCTAGCAAADGFADTADDADVTPIACGEGFTGEKTNTCTGGAWGTDGGDDSACAEVVPPTCTCENGTEAGEGVCTADYPVHCIDCQAYAEAEADDNDANTTEEPEKAGYTLTVVQEVKDGETVTTPWSSTCVAYSCTCWDPAVANADDDDANAPNADGKTVAHTVDENGDATELWANGWADGNQTAATGIWCTEEGGDICVADPPKCGADYTCGEGWTIIADAATTEGATDAECCTEDESESESVDPDADKKMECTCKDDAADTCADAVKALATDADKAACEAVDGAAWTEVKEAEDDEDDASSAAMASAVVALVSLLL